MMLNLKCRVSFLWIYCFTFGITLVYAETLQSKTFGEKVDNQTAFEPSLPFGARLSSSHHQIDRNKLIYETKDISTVPKGENSNGKNPIILGKRLQITDVRKMDNSSRRSANWKNSRRLKNIKSKRRRLRPIATVRPWPELFQRKNLSNVDKSHPFSRSKQASEFPSYAKKIVHKQDGRGNGTILHGSNRLVDSGNIGYPNKGFPIERQINSLRSNERSRVTVPGDRLPEIHRDTVGSIERSSSRVPIDITTRNKDDMKIINRNRVASDQMSRVTTQGNTTILSKDLQTESPRNRFSLNERNGVTIPSDISNWNKDLLSEKLGNYTEPYKGNRGTVLSDTTSRNKDFQSEKQGNRKRLDVISNDTAANETTTGNKDYTKEVNIEWPYERTFVTVADGIATPGKDSLQEKRPNLIDVRERNNTAAANDTMNKNKKLLNVRKDHSPFNFPHSLEKIENKFNFDVHPSKEALPCPCYWSKEKCGCDCTGSLNYDDFQMLAGYFKPCHNFSFSLSDGSYFSMPPNLFTRTSPVQNIHIKISNSTFDYLFDPTPDTSPFRGMVVEHKGLIEVLNVSVRQGWNWGSLKDFRSVGEGIDVVLAGYGLSRLSSDFARVASGDVRELTVSDSGLEMVGSGAFVTFGDLVRFRLPRNRLRSIWRTDLPPEPSVLVEIDLSQNQLQTLDPDLFEGMPSLQVLLLAGNPLATLGEKAFGAVLGRMLLQGLADFPLHCDCRLRWLKNSSLVHNSVFSENLQGAICRRPPHLRGTPFKDLSKEHLAC